MSNKLTTRDWIDADMATLENFHEQMQPGYVFPFQKPLETEDGKDQYPLFFIRRVVLDEHGNIVGAATLKLVSEAFLWLPPSIPAPTRTKAVILLNQELAEKAIASGLEEASAWISPRIVKCFRSVLKKLGWRKCPWSNWSIKLK